MAKAPQKWGFSYLRFIEKKGYSSMLTTIFSNLAYI